MVFYNILSEFKDYITIQGVNNTWGILKSYDRAIWRSVYTGFRFHDCVAVSNASKAKLVSTDLFSSFGTSSSGTSSSNIVYDKNIFYKQYSASSYSNDAFSTEECNNLLSVLEQDNDFLNKTCTKTINKASLDSVENVFLDSSSQQSQLDNNVFVSTIYNIMNDNLVVLFIYHGGLYARKLNGQDITQLDNYQNNKGISQIDNNIMYIVNLFDLTLDSSNKPVFIAGKKPTNSDIYDIPNVTNPIASINVMKGSSVTGYFDASNRLRIYYFDKNGNIQNVVLMMPSLIPG